MLLLVGSSAASCTENAPPRPAGTFCRCHVWPLSVERHRPTFGPLGDWHAGSVPPSKTPIVVPAQIVVDDVEPAVAGSIRILEIDLPLNGPGLLNGLPVLPRSVQVWPPSADRRTPWP